MTKARTLADNYAADINQVTASAPLTGGGTSGTITVGIQDGTTSQKGAVQLEDSTASTSTTKASTPNSVKSAYDLANGAIAKSTVDAKGDLLVGTANDTISRLAVASTAGYVLTVDSAEATGLKWAAAGSGFVGCSIYKSTPQTINNTTNTTLTFNTEEFDTDGFHSNTTNTSRITIPSGKSGKYLVIGQIHYAPNATGGRSLDLYKNGLTDVYQINYPTSSSTYDTGMSFSVIRDLVAGDYLELKTYQNSGGTLDVIAGLNDGRFQVQYLGA